MGDMEAHHELWNSAVEEDQRVTEITGQISDSIYGVINEPSTTRIVSDIIRSAHKHLVYSHRP